MKLTHPNGESLTLSRDLLWVDEFEWSDLAQAEPERTLSGGMIIQQGIKRKGRPITLEPPDDSMTWRKHTRPVVEKLQQWAMLPETEFVLTMPQGEFRVIFDNHKGAVVAEPVVRFSSTNADDCFRVSLRFLTV